MSGSGGRARALVATLIGAGLVALLVALSDPTRLLDAARAAPPLLLLGALAAYALFFLARGIRWRLLVAPNAPDATVATATQLTAVGWLANSLLPLKGGDVLRAALLSRRTRGLTLVSAGASVALERVLDLAGTALVAAVALALLPGAEGLPSWIAPALQVALIAPLVALAALAIVLYKRKRVADLAARASPRFGAMVASTLEDLATIARDPKKLAALAPLTLVIATLQVAVIALLAAAFLGAIDPIVAYAGASLFMLSFVVSFTPGNIGTYEAAFVAVFAALGVEPEVGLSAALLTHAASTLIVATLGGLAFLAMGPSALARQKPVPKALKEGTP